MQTAKYLCQSLISTAIFLGLIAVPVAASAASEAVQINADSIKWGDAPPSLPKGAKVAVLYGDPSKAGPFCMRLVAPAGLKYDVSTPVGIAAVRQPAKALVFVRIDFASKASTF